MNSGLQCLSNTIELTKFFCFGLHKRDLNTRNPLGMGGKLATTYGELVREMWHGSSQRTAPQTLKSIIGKRVTKFSGFGQQDSCELVNYVLDLLHEDMNRVIQKPYVEMKDSEGRADSVVSEEHWQAFLARNQSVIVDLMYGQLKSTVQCLECGNISITFDPFLTLSLPIARPFKMRVKYVPYSMYKATDENECEKCTTRELSIALSKESTVAQLTAKVAEIVGCESDELIVANTYLRKGQIITKYNDTVSC